MHKVITAFLTQHVCRCKIGHNMKKKKISFRIFNKYLKGVTIAQWFINLENIPIGLLTANLMSYVVTLATDGRTSDVVEGSVKLLLLLIGFRIFQSVYNIKLE